MSRYVRNIRVEAKFDGDDVVAILKPMPFSDRLELEALHPSTGDDEATEKAKNKALAPIAVEKVRANLISVDGLKDAEGQPVKVEEVTRDGYFLKLVFALYKDWYAARAPRDPLVSAGTTTGASTESR